MPTPYTPIPETYHQSLGRRYDDEPTFAAPTATYVPNEGAGNFVFGGQTLPLDQREPLAEAIERCFWIDLAGEVDPNGFQIDDGAFAIVPVVTGGDTLSAIKVGSMTLTIGLAASLADAIRHDTGTTAYAGS